MAGLALSQRALLTARFGEARFGASRFGYIPKDVDTSGRYGWSRIYYLVGSWTRIFPVLLMVLLGACVHPKDFGEPAIAMQPPDVQPPRLVLRASPKMGLPPLRVLLTAEIKGDENEKYYCPEVVWYWPNETVSSEAGDCVPFEQRDDYRRRWTRGVTIPVPGRWTFVVELRKAGHVIAREPVTVEVAGSGE